MPRAPEERRYRRMGGANFVDMARTREPPKEAVVPEVPAPPDYPYGLCLALSQDELDKLGASGGEFAIGDIVDLRALAKVTSISQHASDGQESCRVELQITHLGLDEGGAA